MKSLRPVVLVLLIFSCNVNDDVNVFLIGDSTMSDKPNPDRNPERGWGQMLPLFFNENVVVKNFAVNGRSTKSFIDEGRWGKVLSEMKKGDYVFIQFGHNDQKFNDSLRFTNPLTAYRNNLTRFVTEAREKGGIPVLFSPIVRRKFNESGVLIDTHGIYPLIVKQVAVDLNVPFVDLQLKSENLVLTVGQEKSKELYLWVEPGENSYYPEGKQDNTHLSVIGATEVARLAVDGLKEGRLGITKFLKN
ncbi:MAG: rhamnogalacturonan acetylesterase [bacterium]|nr:MAG: rhamnogalacturonan acetylesterase [bacterium]